MAKAQTNAATGASQSLINQANTIMPGVISGIEGLQKTAEQQAGQSFGSAYSGYQQQQQYGGYDPSQLQYMRNTLQSMQATGGVDPTQLANIRGELSNWAPSGGYDPAQLAQTLGGYGDLATTGGYTPQDLQQMINQATSGTTRTASNLSAAAQRNAAATGGNAQAAIANIQNQLGPQQADAATAARLGVRQAQIGNQLQGLGGLASTEQQLAAARQGISGQQAGLETGVASLRQGVSGLQQGLEGGVAQGVQAANRGMAGLFDTASGQVTALGQQVLQGLGLQFGTEAQGAQILQELSKNPGLFQTMIGDIGTLGGAAAGVMRGVAGLGG